MTPDSRTQRTRREGRRGFTLIEMLVVISITMLMMAITLPALAKVRRLARNTKCASNQRQILFTLDFYGADNDQRYPDTVAWYKNGMRGPFMYAHAELNPDVDDPRTVFDLLGEYIPDARVMACPGSKTFSRLQDARDMGDDWDLDDDNDYRDWLYGTYCLYWNYEGVLEDGSLFVGPRFVGGGTGQSKLVTSDYLGYAHWRSRYPSLPDSQYLISCEPLDNGRIIPEIDHAAPLWAKRAQLESDERPDLTSITTTFRAAYADGHVETYSAAETEPMWVIKNVTGPRIWGDLRWNLYELEWSPGIFYLPQNAK